jgi:hypothetical protein
MDTQQYTMEEAKENSHKYLRSAFYLNIQLTSVLEIDISGIEMEE